jgi:hypothetical protein
MGNVTISGSSLVFKNHGSTKFVTGTFAMSSSYATGGDSITAAMLGVSRLISLDIDQVAGYLIQPVLSSSPATSALVKVLPGGDTAHNHTFTGSAPYSPETATVTHSGTPGGNQIYVKYLNNGLPYLCCNMATATADKVITLSGSAGKFIIKHDASASTNSHALYINPSASADSRLLINNAVYAADTYLVTTAGRLVILKHDSSASSNGSALNYDDGADNRLESNLSGAANSSLSCTTVGWVAVSPSGTIGNASASAASEVSNGTDLSSTLATVRFRAVCN